MKKIAIIIVSYNSKKYIDTCLERIIQFPPKLDYEIIVVDNCSSDGSLEHIREKWLGNALVQVLSLSDNKGFGQACNEGVRKTESQYVLFMNPDIIVQQETFDLLLSYMDQHKNVGIVGPQLIYSDGIIQDSYRTFPNFFHLLIKRTALKKIKFFRKKLRKYLLWDKDRNEIEAVDWLVGAFIMVRRSMFDAVEGFDPRYFLFFEDVDLCQKMWNNGYRVVYVPTSKAIHHHERLSAGGIKEIFTKKTVRVHISSAWKYFWKWLFKKDNRKK